MKRKSGPPSTSRRGSAARGRPRARACLSGRGRAVMGVGAIAILTAAGFAYFSGGPASGIVVPTDACASPPPLTTWNDVTLQPVAMVAF